MNPLDKLIVAAGALVAAFLIGMGTMHHHDAKVILDVRTEFAGKLQEARDAKAAAEQRATNTEHAQAQAVADALTTFKKDRQDEKAHDQAVIDGLRSGAQRLRVATTGAACSGPLPGAAAGATGSDAAASQTLAGPVAARLAGRYAEYNELVDQLTMCQAIIRADRQNAP